MENNNFWESLVLFLGLVISAFLVWHVLRLLFFLPYRNTFTCWYMPRFNTDHRAARKVFNEIVEKQKEFAATARFVEEGYQDFLFYLTRDDRFKGLEYFWIPLSGERGQDVCIVDEIILLENTPERLTETFAYFRCDGDNIHKVLVFFLVGGNDIHLHSIQFLYHEESSGHFMYEIEKKEFPTDPKEASVLRRGPVVLPELVIC